MFTNGNVAVTRGSRKLVKLFKFRVGTKECRTFDSNCISRLLSSAVPTPGRLKKDEDVSRVIDYSGQELERFEKKDERPLTNIPFAKELFLGRFDQDMLVFPELSTRAEVDELNEMVRPIERFFEEQIDSAAIDRDGEIPAETLRQLGELGLFGQQIPEEYGGLGLNATRYARLAEVTSLDGGIAVTLAAHQAIGLKGILMAGTEEQKQKYLPKLATGEQIAAFCLTEHSSGSDAASIQTRATLSEDGSTFYLNGGKIWISNGGIAEIMTVFAKTEITTEEGETVDRITAFIVERAFGGVTNGPPEDKLGIRGSNTCDVHFDNTPVPIENVIGEVGGGFKIAMNILNSGRFSMGSAGAGIVRKLISMAAEHAISRTQFGKKLTEFGLIQEKFAKMAVTVYAMESMAYMTAGILDGVQNPDASVEAAMVKVFSSEGVWTCVNECLQVVGGLGYMKSYPFERCVRDARILTIFEGTNEILRLYVALTGVQYAGKELKALVKQMKDPFNNLGLMFKMRRTHSQFMKGKYPALSLGLHEHLHPSLNDLANSIEQSTLMFGQAVQKVLGDYGQKVIDHQIHLRRLADVAIDIYAMTACAARASRSYCVGLKNADHEVMLARNFVRQADVRIMNNIKFLRANVNNGDDEMKEIAKLIFSNHGYAAEHPLTNNLW